MDLEVKSQIYSSVSENLVLVGMACWCLLFFGFYKWTKIDDALPIEDQDCYFWEHKYFINIHKDINYMLFHLKIKEWKTKYIDVMPLSLQ